MATLPEIRQQYPQYNDLSDRQLADKLHERFYSDMPRADFDRRVGLTPQSWGEYGRDLLRQAAQGATFGFADEIEAGARAITRHGGPLLRRGLTDGPPSTAEMAAATAGVAADYSGGVERLRREGRQFSEENPVTALTANLAGGIAPWTFGPLGKLASWSVAGRTLPRTMARSGAVGAGAGGVAGFGAGEGGPAERLESAGTGGLIGAGLGTVLPPVISGIGRGVSGAASLFQRARPRQITEPPPVQPAGTPEPVTGMPITGAQFVDERTMPALNAQEGALRLISDWITSAGGTADDVAGAWQAVQRSGILHSSGRALNAQTLLEIYPPLQRLMRALASGYREVGENALRTFQARQTGILPRGADAADLARRGIPTRERYLPGRTVQENLDEFGVQLGTGAGNISPTGQLGRIVDAGKRLFRIRDSDFHGHAMNANRTDAQILASMEKTSLPARNKAFAAGDMVDLRPTIRPILESWGQRAYDDAPLIGAVVRRALRQFYTTGGGAKAQIISDLRRFDRGKRAVDDMIKKRLGTEAGFTLREFRNELLEAVDAIKQGNVGSLYRTARGAWSGGATERDILTRGSNAWREDPDAVIAWYDSLGSKSHQKLARLAIIGGIEKINLGRRAGQDATLEFDTNRAQALLTAIGQRVRVRTKSAEEVMRRFGNYIGGEEEMVRGTAKTVTGGSMTERNALDAMALGSMEIVQNIQTWTNIWRGSQSMWDLGQKIFEKIIDRAFGPGAERAKEAARMLLTANPEEITAIIARLRMIMPANRMARFNELLKAAQSSAPGISSVGGAAAAPTQQPAFL